MSGETLAALEEKYALLEQLRAEREQAAAEGLGRFAGEAAERRRERMRAVAGRFPGALRELDVLTAAQLRHRREVVQAVRAGAPSPRWLEATALLHRWLKEAPQPAVRPAGGRRMPEVWRQVGAALGVDAAAAERLVYGPFSDA